MPKRKALDVALSLLAKRDYSRQMLKDKLYKKEYTQAEIDAALDHLEELNYLNDQRFSESLVRYRAELSRWGKTRIKQDFYKKGLSSDLADKALSLYEQGSLSSDEQEVNWAENAYVLLEKRFGTYEGYLEPKEKARRINFLLRRGFSQSEALYALEKLKIDS